MNVRHETILHNWLKVVRRHGYDVGSPWHQCSTVEEGGCEHMGSFYLIELYRTRNWFQRWFDRRVGITIGFVNLNDATVTTDELVMPRLEPFVIDLSAEMGKEFTIVLNPDYKFGAQPAWKQGTYSGGW